MSAVKMELTVSLCRCVFVQVDCSREAPSVASSCSSRLGIADVAPKARRRVRISVRFKKIYIYRTVTGDKPALDIYMDGCTELGSDWLIGWLLGNKTIARRVSALRFSD